MYTPNHQVKHYTPLTNKRTYILQFRIGTMDEKTIKFNNKTTSMKQDNNNNYNLNYGLK